ncbi:MAG TPA: hypothetical protein VHA55_05635 [Pseudorhodoplanes sp.]|jgi:hypothetical protein|nr:hypothetical protein [Pseudorhodoplanes sp.]
MPLINGRFYSSWGRYSAYTALQIQRYRMAAARQQEEANISSLIGTINDVMTNSSQGLAQIAAQRAVDRINAETKAKTEQASSDTGTADDNIIPSTMNSTFSVTDSTRLDGGSQVDLNANTLTLPNGTVIDLDTGLKKIDVTT